MMEKNKDIDDLYEIIFNCMNFMAHSSRSNSVKERFLYVKI